MCCAAQKCTVTKQTYFTKNLELPSLGGVTVSPEDATLAPGRDWCTQYAKVNESNGEDIEMAAGEERAECYFRCRLGFYNLEVGEGVIYSCQANADRLVATGRSATLQTCSGIASTICTFIWVGFKVVT